MQEKHNVPANTKTRQAMRQKPPLGLGGYTIILRPFKQIQVNGLHHWPAH